MESLPARRRSRVTEVSAALTATLLLLGMVRVAAGDLKSLTTPQELVMGQIFAEQVELQYPLLRDPVVDWYVNLRGRQLADKSPRNNLPYFFGVIDSTEINAFAIPGGHIYLNLGTMQVADDEAELLGILAHEVGHVVARHSAKQIVKEQWASIALTTAIGAYPNYYADLAGNLFGELGFLKMGRDAEREADQLGFQIMVNAGYDPYGMITMFEHMLARYKDEPGRLEKLFLTHPPTQERIDNLKALLAATTLPEGLRLNTAQYREVTRRVADRYPAPTPDEEQKKEKGNKPAGGRHRDRKPSTGETPKGDGGDHSPQSGSEP